MVTYTAIYISFLLLLFWVWNGLLLRSSGCHVDLRLITCLSLQRAAIPAMLDYSWLFPSFLVRESVALRKCHTEEAYTLCAQWRRIAQRYLQFLLILFTFHLALCEVSCSFLLQELNAFTLEGLQLTLMEKFRYFAFGAKLELSVPERRERDGPSRAGRRLMDAQTSFPHHHIMITQLMIYLYSEKLL